MVLQPQVDLQIVSSGQGPPIRSAAHIVVGTAHPKRIHSDDFDTMIDENANRGRPCIYLATFDPAGAAMDGPDGDAAADGAFFRNFLSGMS